MALPSRWIVAALLTPSLLVSPATAVEAPNVVLILLDDVGYGDLGAYGGSFVRTPNLDALAADGMRFTEYHSNAAVCTPARAAILTGHYPIRFGLRDALARGTRRGIPAGVETIATRLRAAGYATGHFGKWHLGGRPEQRPTRQGFDRSLTLGAATDPVVSIDDAAPTQVAGHPSEITTDHAIAFIAAHGDRPFFANVWYNAAHAPYEPPAEWAARYPDTDSGRYAAVLSHADAEIGRIVAELRRLDLEQRTLVLVSSDNGGLLRAIATNGSLRGYKRDVFEGGLRVPLIARWPGAIPAGSVNASLWLGIDLLPTLAALAGAPVGPGFPGRSMVDALLGGAEVHREAPCFWETADPSSAFTIPPADPHAYAVRRADWKLVRQSVGEEPARAMLFHLASDPGETSDLAAAHPELVQELEREYRLWRARESRIEVPIAHVAEGASALGPWLRFSGGKVELAPDARLEIDDGDLSFAVRVTPADLATEQVLAAQTGSFSLVLTPSGSLRLTLRGKDERTVELETPPRLQPGVASEVAFAVFGRSFGASVRLYVDGRLEAEASEPDAVRIAPPGPVRIGNGSAGTRPFRGLLWAPRFHAASLAPADLADLDFDGIPNAEDDCVGVPNGPLDPDRGGYVQRDVDADGIGSACDPDANGDGVVDLSDRLALWRAFGTRRGEARYAAEVDWDGDGAVGFLDVMTLERSYGMPPGPSGLVCSPTARCADP